MGGYLGGPLELVIAVHGQPFEAEESEKISLVV
jgi:hypothetical protein